MARGWILVAGREHGAANRGTGCVALSRPISVLALLTLHQHLRVCVCVCVCERERKRERESERWGLQAKEHAAIRVLDEMRRIVYVCVCV